MGSYELCYTDALNNLLLQVRVGGLIVIDNVLWHGKVADPLVNKFFCDLLFFQLSEPDLLYYLQVHDPKTISIRNFNQKLMEDERVNISMVGLYHIFLNINTLAEKICKLIYNWLTFFWRISGTNRRRDDDLPKRLTHFLVIFKFYAIELTPLRGSSSVRSEERQLYNKHKIDLTFLKLLKLQCPFSWQGSERILMNIILIPK